MPYEGIPRVFQIDTGRAGAARFQTPVRRPHTIRDSTLDSEQFIMDYEDKNRGFNPLLWLTYKLHQRKFDALLRMGYDY